MYNHEREFRPLRGGIEIFNAAVGEVGTLGFVAEDVSGGPLRWIVSCYHVLVGGPNRLPVHGEAVFQPSSGTVAVASVDDARTDPVLDCAAAMVLPGIETVGDILAAGPLGGVAEPESGMRVLKSGSASGVTEGTIERVDGDTVVIRAAPGFDGSYDISLAGDSGSLWMRRHDLAPVAMHLRGWADTSKHAEARRISSVLASLRLRMIADASA